MGRIYSSIKAGVKAGCQSIKRRFDAVAAPEKQVKDFVKNDFLKPTYQGLKDDFKGNIAKVPLATGIAVVGAPLIFAESVITETIPGLVKNVPVFDAAKAAMKEYKKTQ